METRTMPNIDEVPVVSRPGQKDIDDVVVELIKANLFEEEGIMQSAEHHIFMIEMQSRLGNFFQYNFSIDRDKLMSVRMRCRELLASLDLIADASNKIRCKSNDQ